MQAIQIAVKMAFALDCLQTVSVTGSAFSLMTAVQTSMTFVLMVSEVYNPLTKICAYDFYAHFTHYEQYQFKNTSR